MDLFLDALPPPTFEASSITVDSADALPDPISDTVTEDIVLRAPLPLPELDLFGSTEKTWTVPLLLEHARNSEARLKQMQLMPARSWFRSFNCPIAKLKERKNDALSITRIYRRNKANVCEHIFLMPATILCCRLYPCPGAAL